MERGGISPARNLREAAIHNDQGAFEEARKFYIAQGGNEDQGRTYTHFRAFVQSLDPLRDLPKEKRQAFVNFLSDEQAEKLGTTIGGAKRYQARLMDWWRAAEETALSPGYAELREKELAHAAEGVTATFPKPERTDTEESYAKRVEGYNERRSHGAEILYDTSPEETANIYLRNRPTLKPANARKTLHKAMQAPENTAPRRLVPTP
jgi:hypothetical protein